jgi:hypothetical protein
MCGGRVAEKRGRSARLARWQGGGTDADKIHRLRRRIKDDLDFTTVELTHDVRDFLFEGKFFLAVIGALAQHVGFDDASQQVCGECGARNHDWLVRLVIQVRDS